MSRGTCLQAIRVMRQQSSGGHIFVMDGAGADGNATPRFAAYGATKRSLAQFIKSLQVALLPYAQSVSCSAPAAVLSALLIIQLCQASSFIHQTRPLACLVSDSSALIS